MQVRGNLVRCYVSEELEALQRCGKLADVLEMLPLIFVGLCLPHVRVDAFNQLLEGRLVVLRVQCLISEPVDRDHAFIPAYVISFLGNQSDLPFDFVSVLRVDVLLERIISDR